MVDKIDPLQPFEYCLLVFHYMLDMSFARFFGPGESTSVDRCLLTAVSLVDPPSISRSSVWHRSATVYLFVIGFFSGILEIRSRTRLALSRFFYCTFATFIYFIVGKPQAAFTLIILGVH